MRVCGVEIRQAQIDACISEMRTSCRSAGYFSLLKIEAAAQRAGVPNQVGERYQHIYPAHRLADRLLQRERKAGNIEPRRLHGLCGVQWFWIGPP